MSTEDAQARLREELRHLWEARQELLTALGEQESSHQAADRERADELSWIEVRIQQLTEELARMGADA